MLYKIVFVLETFTSHVNSY